MGEKFVEKKLKQKQFYLEESHFDFLNSFVKNASEYIRWMIDTNPDYKQYIKDLKSNA